MNIKNHIIYSILLYSFLTIIFIGCNNGNETLSPKTNKRKKPKLNFIDSKKIINSISKNTSEKILNKIIPVIDRQYSSNAIRIIKKAKKKISISMFVIKKGTKVNALIKELKNAANQGIKINILIENKIRGNQSIINSLKGEKNINIKFDSSQKTTHNKIIIIDKTIVLIGSTNWTESSLGYANEANVIIENREIAEYFQEYFNYLWKDSSKDISPFKNFKGEIIPIIDRQYFKVVYKMMSKSVKRIFIMVYGYKTSYTGNTKGDVLADEIIKAQKRGVKTEILLEKSNFNDQLNRMNGATIEYFKKNNVNAKFDNENIITHSKVVIIDDAVILGATNWSYSGLEKWHNTDILIKEKKIVEFFVNYFNEKIRESNNFSNKK